MSIRLVCGAECHIAAAGLAAAANRHWSAVAGAPAIDTGVFRSGAKSLKFAAAATRPNVTYNIAASQTVLYFRAYFYLTDATPSSALTMAYFDSGTSASSGYITVSTGGVLQVSYNNANHGNGPTLSDNTWYGIEAEFDIHANPNVIRWRTWSAAGGWVAQTNVSIGQAAAVYGTAGFQFGIVSGAATSGWTLYMDDIVGGAGTSAGEDYDTSASKGGKVLRYLPTGDGTHTFNDGDFKYNNSTNITNAGVGASPVYPYLDDDDQTSLTDYISQNVAWASGTKALMVTFDNEATETGPRAVAVVSTHHSSGTGANEINIRVSDDGTNWTNVWGDWAGAGVDVSDTTAHYLYKVLTAKPSTGAWTVDAVNGMRAHFGQSNDVNAIPFYDSISIEVAWTESSADTADAPAGTATGAAQVAAPKVAPNAGLVTATEATYSPAPKVAPAPAAGAATGAARQTSQSVKANATAATATGAASSPTVRQGKDVTAGQATATGEAQAPSESARTNAAAGTATGAALTATPRVRPAATASTAAGAASDATVSTASMTNVNAPVATGAGAARTASGSVRPTTAAGTATEAAHQPSPRVRPTTTTAAATGAAGAATAATVSGVEVQAGHAASVAAAWGVAPNVVAAAQAAASTGVAQVVDVAAVGAVTYGTVRVRDSLTDSVTLATSLVASVGPTAGIVDSLDVQRLAATLVPVVSQVGDVRVLDE